MIGKTGCRRAVILALLIFVPIFAWHFTRPHRDLLPDKGSRPYELDALRYPADFLGPDTFDIIVFYLLEQHRRWGVRDAWAQRLWDASYPTIQNVLTPERRELAFRLLEHPNEPLDKINLGPGVSLQKLAEGELPECFLDALVVEYCKLKRNAYVAFLMPRAHEQKAKVKESLKAAGPLVYEKEISLTPKGSRNFVLWTYNFLCDAPHKWVHEEPRATKQIAKRFNKQVPLTVFVLESESWKSVRSWKLEARKLPGMSTTALHTPDTHRETVAMAQILFNGNGLHFLNHCSGLVNVEMKELLTAVKEKALQPPYPMDTVCFDGDGVLALYGVNDEGRNFSLLRHGEGAQWDAIIFNPENHFSFAGMKFAALHRLSVRP